MISMRTRLKLRIATASYIVKSVRKLNEDERRCSGGVTDLQRADRDAKSIRRHCVLLRSTRGQLQMYSIATKHRK